MVDFGPQCILRRGRGLFVPIPVICAIAMVGWLVSGVIVGLTVGKRFKRANEEYERLQKIQVAPSVPSSTNVPSTDVLHAYISMN